MLFWIRAVEAQGYAWIWPCWFCCSRIKVMVHSQTFKTMGSVIKFAYLVCLHSSRSHCWLPHGGHRVYIQFARGALWSSPLLAWIASMDPIKSLAVNLRLILRSSIWFNIWFIWDSSADVDAMQLMWFLGFVCMCVRRGDWNSSIPDKLINTCTNRNKITCYCYCH